MGEPHNNVRKAGNPAGRIGGTKGLHLYPNFRIVLIENLSLSVYNGPWH